MAECIASTCAPEFFQFFSQGTVRVGLGFDINIFAVSDSVRKFGENPASVSSVSFGNRADDREADSEHSRKVASSDGSIIASQPSHRTEISMLAAGSRFSD